MTIKQILSGLTLFLSVVAASQGAMLTTLDWQFNSWVNPAAPTPAPDGNTINPSGGIAAATISSGAGTGYSFGVFQNNPDSYGTQSGLWDTLHGQFQLSLNAVPLTPDTTLNYTLKIDQFVSRASDPFPFSGTVAFSLPNETYVGRTLIQGTGLNGLGDWYEDTYTWSSLTLPGTVGVTITAGAGVGELLVDRIQFAIDGDLTAVPEPVVTQSLAAAGLALFGLWWRRRKV